MKGVNINCTVAPGLIFYNVYEIDDTEYEDSGSEISYSTALGLNFDNAGAKIIIADDSTNTVTGSHVAKCYKYTVDGDTITVTTTKRAKYDLLYLASYFQNNYILKFDSNMDSNDIINK